MDQKTDKKYENRRGWCLSIGHVGDRGRGGSEQEEAAKHFLHMAGKY